MSNRTILQCVVVGGLLAAVVLAARPETAAAGILTKGSDAQKQRLDIAKQVAKYWSCVLKATAKCERDGGHSGLECDPQSGHALPPADPKGTFAAALAKCDEKLDFNKKGSGDPTGDYVAMTCPQLNYSGNSSVDQLQANVISGIRYLVFVRLNIIDSICPQPDQSVLPEAVECAATYLELTNKFMKLALKCQEKCENDYSGKKGNGGKTNVPVCISMAAPDPNYLACLSDAIDTATKNTTSPDYPSYLTSVAQQVETIWYSFYNYLCP